MLIQNETVTGLDLRIQAHQRFLHTYILNAWGVSTDKYKCYGRVYRNRRGQGYVPEVLESGKEYKEVLFDNSLQVQSFYGIGNNQKISGKQYSADIHLIFFTNLTAIKTELAHRGDMEVRKDLFIFLRRNHFSLEPIAEKTGVESVLSDYPGKAKDTLLSKADMHPWHCFRFDFKCIYDPLTNIK